MSVFSMFVFAVWWWLSQDGTTPLLAAVKGSYDTIVKELLAGGANVNLSSQVPRSWLLVAACCPIIVIAGVFCRTARRRCSMLVSVVTPRL